ncbi:tyrosine-protein kinase [uncultured Mucilaginibacter sp.]|uniref:GumC family protein n=1 Tax=uncultured Mucilaginibacter sp. TaxID=797541 RepID=UPI00261FD8FC|nr:tyrosine-protein kinase [uncultured Mucilaginibacter sp.]
MDNDQLYYETPAAIQEDNFKQLKYFFSQCLYHWPLFLIGIILTTGIAYYITRSEKPSYLASARLLVNIGKANEAPTLQSLNAATVSKGVDNEIEILKSRPLVVKAVKDLSLYINYEEVGKYYQKDIYATSPIHFRLIGNGKITNQQVFDIIVLAGNRFALYKSNGTFLNASFDNILKNNFGEWKLDPTANLNNYIGKKIRISVYNPDMVAAGFQGRIFAMTPTPESNLVNLSISDEVPERGKAFLNALITNYVNATKENKKQATANALSFLNDRLASVSQDLNNVEKKAAGYKSSNQFTDISAKGSTYLGNVTNNDAKLAELNIQLDLLAGIETYINSSRNEGNAPTVTGITDPSLGSLVGQLSVAQQQKNKLLATTQESNPILEPFNKQIASLKDAIKETIRGVRSSLLTTKRQLEANSSKYESSFKEVPEQEKEFVNITRQKSLKEDQYLYLSQQRETIALNYASTISDVQIVDQPHDAGLSPSKTPTVLTCAFLLGLILPAGFVYGRNAVKNQITDKREIESSTNIPVVAEVNYEEDNSLQTTISRSGNLLGEQIRELRTKLSYLHQKKPMGRVTLLTSSTSAEGKSFITSNLGAAIAASGKKTIILELDMRKPKISKIFDLDPGHLGISDFLSGKVNDINKIIQTSSLRSNLFVIGAGTLPDNPAELLENYRMQELIDALKAEYADILFDTPPVHLVTDAFIIADLTDVTLYIVRQGYTSKEELDFIKRVAKDKRLRMLNIVFNGIQNKKFGGGYHYDNSYYTQNTKKKSTVSVLKNFMDRF